MKGAGQGGKKSGMPSTRASDAAERSPTVYFANLKADMLLQRQLHVIKRAESALVHRISIEQKILFRRFQAKLRRSKIARARLWGDKNTERELRQRDLHVLNTNCGQEQDDFDFLKKLEQRPCVAGDEVKVKARPHTAEVSKTTVTDKDMEELIHAVMREQVPPPTDKTLQSLSTLGRLLEEAQLMSADKEPTAQPSGKLQKPPVRPATTDLGVRQTETKPSASKRPGGRPQTQTSPQPDTARSATPHARHASKSPPRQVKPSPPTQRKKPRPLTSPAVVVPPQPQDKGPAKKEAAPSPRTPAASSRRKSVQFTGNSRRASHQTSMFEESEKVDLVAMRLEAAKATDLTPKVDAFLKSLDETERRCRERKLKYQVVDQYGEMNPEDPQLESAQRERERDLDDSDDEVKGDRKFDYYATKMAIYISNLRREKLPSLPGTPEEVHKREMGNYAIKNLTMPRLCLDFDVSDDGDGVDRSVDKEPPPVAEDRGTGS